MANETATVVLVTDDALHTTELAAVNDAQVPATPASYTSTTGAKPAPFTVIDWVIPVAGATK